MSWKDDLKKSQSGEQSNYPQFLKKVQYYLEIKANEKGKISFKYYDREKQENVFITKPIKGVLIGSSMRASAFNPNAGRNGSELTTSAYFTNKDKGVVFGMGKQLFNGTIEQCHQYMNDETNALKKKKELYIITEQGALLAIRTSVTLSIVDIDAVGESIADNWCNFVPREYVPEEHTKKAHSFLGKFASTNRPKYANIRLSEDVIDDDFGINVIKPFIDLFDEFKEFTTTKGAADDIDEVHDNTETQTFAANTSEPEDDMPF